MSKPGADASKQNRRVHLSIVPGTRAGTVIFRLTAREPDPAGAMAALLSRGMLMGETLDLQVVTDPSLDPALRGIDGKSAYQLARDNGYGGTLAQWLLSLVGGNGKSAYEIARELGYGGTKTQWLTTLVGAPGKDAASLLGSVTLSETNLANFSAGVQRRSVTTGFDLPAGVPLLLLPKSPPPIGWIVQAAWALTVAKPRELTVDLTLPSITLLSGYSIDCWLLRINA